MATIDPDLIYGGIAGSVVGGVMTIPATFIPTLSTYPATTSSTPSFEAISTLSSVPWHTDPFAKTQETVKTSIGNRVVESLVRLVEDVDSGKLSLEHGYYVVFMLVDTFSPFCSTDVATIMGEVEKKWRDMVNKQKDKKKEVNSLSESYHMDDAF